MAFTDDMELVELDPTTGEERRVLVRGFGEGSLDEDGVEQSAYVVDGITIDNERDRILFGTCCEPVSGLIVEIDAEGNEVRSDVYATRPAIPRDGSMLAAIGMEAVMVWDRATGDERHALESVVTVDGAERFLSVTELVWSADGTRLAMVVTDFDEGISEVRVFDLADGPTSVHDGTVVATAPVGSDSVAPVTRPLFTPDGMVSWIRQDLVDGEDGPATLERIPVDLDPDALELEPLSSEVVSRFVDQSGAEWRLGHDGRVTVDGELRFTTPGLRDLVGAPSA